MMVRMLPVLIATLLFAQSSDKLAVAPELPAGQTTDAGPFAGKVPTSDSKTIQLTPEYTLKVSYVLKDPVDIIVPTNITCGGVCEGKKHVAHEQCDSSCDLPCKGGHTFWVSTTFSPENDPPLKDPSLPNFHPTQALSKMIAQDMSATVGLKEGLVQSATHLVEDWVRSSESNKPVDVPCFYLYHKPCMQRRLQKRSRKWRVVAHYEISGGLNNAHGDGEIGTYVSDSPNPVLGKEFLACQCDIVKKDDSGNPIQDKSTMPDDAASKEVGQVPGVKMDLGNGPFVAGPGQQKLCGMTVQPQDLSHAKWTVNNPYSMPMYCSVSPGTICKSEDPAYQTLVVVVLTQVRVDSKSSATVTLLTSTNPEFPQDPSVLTDLSTACIEMNKLTPVPGVPFHFEMGQNPLLTAIGSLINGQNFRGPFNQALIWMLTDHASFDDIVHKLLLSPPAGRYAGLLMDLEQVIGVNTGHPDFKKLLDPKLLLSTVAKEETTKWLVGKLGTSDKSGTIKWLASHTTDFKLSLKDLKTDAEAIALKHVADVANSLVSSADPAEQAAALELITKSVPESLREPFARAGGLDGVVKLVSSNNPILVDLSMKLLAQFKDKQTSYGLLNIDPSMPPDVMTKAKDLYKSIMQSP